MDLATPVDELARPHEVAALHRLGVRTVAELLLLRPRDWTDLSAAAELAGMADGSTLTVMGVVMAHNRKFVRGRQIVEVRVRAESGEVVRVSFFNQPYRYDQLRPGVHAAFGGKLSQRWGPELTNPTVELLRGGREPRRLDRLVPVYPLSGGLKEHRLRELVGRAIHLADRFPESLPAEILNRRALPAIGDAVRWSHQPGSLEELASADRRFRHEKLLQYQLAFLVEARRLHAEAATPVPYVAEVGDRFKAGLGFELTGAQRGAARDIFKDLQRPLPMTRLLNGDVGSGKTAVAAAAVAMAHAAGLQSLVMAPTEILARQHLHKFRAYLEPSFPDLAVDLLVSGLPAAERRRVRTAVASGHTALLVGTHALIQEDLEIPALGLAVVDEQHRFGTRQRELLRAKGAGRPHFLAMTATPIPRTLQLALYGETSVSVLDELPPGRTPIETEYGGPADRDRYYRLIREQVAAGHQAFVICPLVEESEKLEAKAAIAEHERLSTEVFPDLRVGLVHGRLKEKDRVMAAFAAGELDVIVATPVVEVGVDVPNATVMLIEGAERFGLAQLHQFRGRVGRGAARSYCLLLSEAENLERLRLLVATQDGFRLAEEDLRLRGAGEFFGARQHGDLDEAMRALSQPQLLSEARDDAEWLLAMDPELSGVPELKGRVERLLEYAIE